MRIDEFNAMYQYAYDDKQFNIEDAWLIPKIVDGKIVDDCDGYALGVLYYVVCNQSLIKFWRELIFGEAKIHYVSNEGGHAVLQFDGMYIDNWTKDWVSREHMESLGHKFHKRDYMAYQVFLKMAHTKLQMVFKYV